MVGTGVVTEAGIVEVSVVTAPIGEDVAGEFPVTRFKCLP